MAIQDLYIEKLIELAEDAVYDGHYSQARKLIETGLMEEPGYPKLHYTLGWMFHYYQVNEALAERHYLLAIHFDPDYEDPLVGLVELFMMHRRYGPLRTWLEEAKKRDQADQQFILTALGKVAEKQGDFTHAMKYYRQALMACTDNYDTKELRQHIKRIRFKRVKTILKRWQLQN